MMRSSILYIAACFIIIALSPIRATAQEEEVVNELQPRINMELGYTLAKNLKISFTPEVRLEDNFSVDKYLLELGADYKLKSYLKLSSAYRYYINIRDKKSTEYSHRYSFSATGEKKFNRLSSSLRLRYSNDADDESEDRQFLRYKAGLKYNIPKCKLTPSIAFEAFQNLDGGSSLYKTRYSTGLKYKLSKGNSIEASYKFDLYRTDYINKHIVSVGYKIKL